MPGIHSASATATATSAKAGSGARCDAFDLRLARGQLGAGLAFDLPLTSRAADVLPAIGDLSLNASANVRHVARFGTLTDSTLGLAWTPLTGVQVLANLRRSAAAPDLQQLSTPPRVIDNVPIFDFASGRTEAITLLLGGNPDLRAERRRTRTLSLTWQPWAARPLRLATSYEVTTIRDQTGTVFATTPRVEALLPDLFVRDAAGRLRSVAFRPGNFAWQRQRKLQLSLTASGRIGRPPIPAAEGTASTPDKRPSFYLGAVPILALEDRLQPSAGSAFLDLLDGDSIGTFVPRWSGYAYGGVNAGGYGGTFSLYYGGTRRIRSDDPASDLTFLPILQLGFTGYLPADDLLPAQDWARGLQLRLEVADLLDSRQRVRDANGQVPSRFQTDLISPLGRIVTLSLRQRF